MLLVAVSGGIDSMCLAEKVRLEGGPFAIAHCNFQLRGCESDGDEALVQSWANAHGITCHVRHFDTSAYAEANGISIEMAARELRYRWFGELCREYGYEGVAVAHNANDNAETLILNLLRGTGIKGILGMKPVSSIPDPDYADVPLLRPLLGMSREEIEAFAAACGLPWREDSTNALNDYKRNKIRNLVFPVFRDINPRFVETLNRDMARFASELTADIPAPAPEEVRPSVTPIIPSITEEVWDGVGEVKQPEGHLILDADKAGEFTIGTWESGDWIRPLGAPGKKKLQDWFTDHHIPQEAKKRILLLRSAKDRSHILAIAGFCIDHSVRVTSSTTRIIALRPSNQ